MKSKNVVEQVELAKRILCLADEGKAVEARSLAVEAINQWSSSMIVNWVDLNEYLLYLEDFIKDPKIYTEIDIKTMNSFRYQVEMQLTKVADAV